MRFSLLKLPSCRQRPVILAVIGASALQGIFLVIAVMLGITREIFTPEVVLKTASAPSGKTAEAVAASRTSAEFARAHASAHALELPKESLESFSGQLEMDNWITDTLDAGTALASLQMNAFSAFSDTASATAPLEMDFDTAIFMGQSVTARRILLIVDISASVKSKVERSGRSMELIREEVRTFVESLSAGHLFGILQFSRSWDSFRNEMVPATTAMKTEARQWLEHSFRTSGTSGRNWKRPSPDGIIGVLRAAFAFDEELDEIILLSDGDFQTSLPGGGGKDVPWSEIQRLSRALQEDRFQPVRISMISFYPEPQHARAMHLWTRNQRDGWLKILSGETNESSW